MLRNTLNPRAFAKRVSGALLPIRALLFILTAILLCNIHATCAFAAEGTPDLSAFAGPWKFNKELSTNLNSWRAFDITLEPRGTTVAITRKYTIGRRTRVEAATYDFAKSGAPITVAMPRWTEDRCMGVYAAGDKAARVTPKLLDNGRVIRTDATVTVSVQQGMREINVLSDYKLSPDGNHLTLIEVRSSRDLPIVYIFDRVTP